MTTEQLEPCPKCGSTGKIKGTIVFGHLTMECPDCGWKITSKSRSGCHKLLLDEEMAARWNNGEEGDEVRAKAMPVLRRESKI